jgi:hypothetical protein
MCVVKGAVIGTVVSKDAFGGSRDAAQWYSRRRGHAGVLRYGL